MTRPLHPLLARLTTTCARPQTTASGCEVQWHVLGSGPPLVLLHGGHGGWLHWVRNIEALATQHRVCVPDMPGYGDSGNPPSAQGDAQRLQALGAALAGHVDALLGTSQPIAVAAFSFGALASAALWQQRGGIHRLAWLGPAGHRTRRRRTVTLQAWKDLPEPARADALRHNLHAFMLHGTAPDDLALDIHTGCCERTRFHSASLSMLCDLAALMTGFDAPVLQLWGEHDVTAVPGNAAQRLAGGRPERPWVVLPGAGHWVQYEQAQAVNEHLLDWFALQGRYDAADGQPPQMR